MKKSLAIVTAAVLTVGLASFASAHGGWGSGQMMWNRNSGNYGRGQHTYAGNYGERGRHMYARNEDGRGYGPGYCRGNTDRSSSFGEVDKAEVAAEIVAGRLEDTGNPNLKVGKVTEVGRDFEVEIMTKDGSLANKVLVEKATGRIIPAFNN